MVHASDVATVSKNSQPEVFYAQGFNLNALICLTRASTNAKHWSFIGLLAITVLSIWLSGNPEFRFQPLPDALHHPELRSDAELQPWVIEGEPGHVEISDEGVTLSLDVPSKLQAHTKRFFDWDAQAAAGATHFMIKGELERLSRETRTSAPRERPSFSVRLRDNGKRNGNGLMVRARGNLQVEKFTELIVPHAGSDQLDIYWRLFLPGTWRLNEFSMLPVQTSSGYYIAMGATLIPFATALVFVTISVCRNLKPIQALLLSGLCSIAVTSIAIAESTMKQLREALLERLPFVTLADWWQSHLYQVQESGHVLVFALLAVVAFWVRERLKATHFQLVTSLLLWALLTEALQRHSLGRTPSMSDIGLDIIGITVGLGICWMCHSVRKYRMPDTP